jgi:O-succinylbenzoic acid--CoA ligase
MGRAMQGVRLSVDADTGCLVVSGPAVAWGYWPEPEARLAGGVFRSTDLARVDADGEVRLEGRAAEVINVAGLKVAPDTVEQVLMTHPAVADCVVFGIPDDAGRGEAVGVVYRLRTGTGWQELRAYLAGRLASWQVPRRGWHRADLGVDGRGKRSRAMWRERVLGAGGGMTT